MQRQAPGRFAHGARVEARALDDHARRLVADLSARAAHDAGQGDRARRIGDHKIGLEQLALFAVERLERLPLLGATYDDVPVGDLVGVKGVQRLTTLMQHQVGHVHEVVDGALPDRSQAVLHPLRRGADLDAAQERGGVPGAARLVLDLHGDLRRRGLLAGVRRQPLPGHGGQLDRLTAACAAPAIDQRRPLAIAARQHRDVS